MTMHRVVARHPVDLPDGLVGSPGDAIDLDPTDPLVVAHIADGHLVEIPDPTDTAPSGKGGTKR